MSFILAFHGVGLFTKKDHVLPNKVEAFRSLD
jgi:hypothetical protein